MVSAVVALCSPVDGAGGVLFSAHMLQHELLMVVTAPLLVLARPVPAMLRALPRGWRAPVAHGALRPYQALAQPTVAWAFHALALWVWHFPWLFDLSVRNDAVHALQHASFFFAALVFWESLLVHRRGYAIGVISLFTTTLHMGALAGIITLADVPWYRAYAYTTAAWGLTPLEDQQLGGLIMWIPAGLVYVVAALWMGGSLLRTDTKPLEARN
jgi:putative membrane protein